MNSRISRLVFGGMSYQSGEIADTGLISSPTAPERPAIPLLDHLRFALLSDESLATELQAGNQDALTPLFQRYGPLLLTIARRILGNEGEAEDAVQLIFLDVFRSIQHFDPEKARFKTWLMMFAYHRTFNRRRSLSASRFYVTEAFDPLTADPRCEQSVTFNHAAYSTVLINQLLRDLQPRQRQTIELIYYEGLTAEEVSDRTGETVRVVRHNLYRGLEKLRKGLFRPSSACDPGTAGGAK